MATQSFPAAESLEDVSFLLPFAKDCHDRLENVRAVTQWILRNFDSRVLIGGHDVGAICLRHARVQYVTVERSDDDIWRPGIVRNALAEKAASPIVAVWDADVWCDPDQVRDAAAMIRDGHADFAYPYDGRFIHIGTGFAQDLADDALKIDADHRPQIRHPGISKGGAVLVDAESYRAAGRENTEMKDWCPDDVDRDNRLRNLRHKDAPRAHGPLYHLDHQRPHEHFFGNPFRQQNWLQVEGVNEQALPELLKEPCPVCHTFPG